MPHLTEHQPLDLTQFDADAGPSARGSSVA